MALTNEHIFLIMVSKMMREIRNRIESGERHEVICETVADIMMVFEDDGFPIWLSRIVEGEQRDYQNKEGHWYKTE